MRTVYIAMLAMLGLGCAASPSELAQPELRRLHPNHSAFRGPQRTVTIAVPGLDAEEIVERAHERAGRAFDILAARYACYMPIGGIETLRFEGKWEDQPAPERASRMNAYCAEWIRTESNQEDYDFLGVDVSASPDGQSVVITSKFGDSGGLARVADWIRAKLALK